MAAVLLGIKLLPIKVLHRHHFLIWNASWKSMVMIVWYLCLGLARRYTVIIRRCPLKTQSALCLGFGVEYFLWTIAAWLSENVGKPAMHKILIVSVSRLKWDIAAGPENQRNVSEILFFDEYLWISLNSSLENGSRPTFIAGYCHKMDYF